MMGVLLAVTSVALCGCSGLDFSGQDTPFSDVENLVHRWKVTDATGTVLSQGCGLWNRSDNTAYYLAQQDYWAARIQVKAAPGATIVDQDNFGTQDVIRKHNDGTAPLPTTDAYWCSTSGSPDISTSEVGGLDQGVTVVGQDPPATIESFALIDPHKAYGGTGASGFTIKLLVHHTGVVRLSIPAWCPPEPGTLDADTSDTGASDASASDGSASDADGSGGFCSTPTTYGALTIVQ